MPGIPEYRRPPKNPAAAIAQSRNWFLFNIDGEPMMTDPEWAIFYNTMMSSEDMLETWATYCVATPVYPEELENFI